MQHLHSSSIRLGESRKFHDWRVPSHATVIEVTGYATNAEHDGAFLTLDRGNSVDKLPQVQHATALMREAKNWSVMKWLREKKHVRAAADQANSAIDALREKIHRNWPGELQSAYLAFESAHGEATQKAGDNQAQTKLKHVWEADQQASQARTLAEKTFDDAEKQLSTRLAREGCERAIHSWGLHKIAISKAAALMRTK